MTNKEYVASQLDDIITALNNIKNAVMESEEKETECVENRDIPIGKTFEFEGKEYIAKEVSNIEKGRLRECDIKSICDICAFDKIDNRPCDNLCCAGLERRDKTEAYFVEK